MTDKSISHYERELLLAHILGVSREYVLTHPEIRLTPAQTRKLDGSIERRQQNEPLAYILGHREFYGLDFKVSPDTLIPRPETEMLVKIAIQDIRHMTRRPKMRGRRCAIIDIGTGSGNIIISAAHSTKDITKNKINYYGSDISAKALKVARHNAKKYRLDRKIKFIEGNLLDPFLSAGCSMPYTDLIIVANLPYLSKKIYRSTMTDVKKFEPKSALLSGQDGLAHYGRLFLQIRKLKKKSSSLHILCSMEISPEQKKKLEKLIENHFPGAKAEFRKDMAQKWRICSLEL